MPGLELLGAEGVCDVLDRITQTVGVVIGGVDAPARHDRDANDTLNNTTYIVTHTNGSGCRTIYLQTDGGLCI